MHKFMFSTLVLLSMGFGPCMPIADLLKPIPEQPKPADPRPRCALPGQISVAEICNGFDDDCDGEIDEGVCNDICDDAW